MGNGHFDTAAEDYAMLMTKPWHVLRRHSALANLLRHGPVADLWIDVGAGTGEGAALLVTAGAQVVAVDDAPTMSSALANLAGKSRGLTAAVPEELVQWKGMAAGATMHNVIEYAPDRQEFIGMVAKCLRPGGLLSIVCANPFFSLYSHAVRGATPKELLEAVFDRRTTVGMPESRFTVPDYTVDECVRDAQNYGLTLLEHRGIRVLSDFAPHHRSQRAPDWITGMLQLERVLGAHEPYRSTSRHWQLIYRKESQTVTATRGARHEVQHLAR